MSTRLSTISLRAVAAALSTAVLVLAGAGISEAHVQVIPDQTAAGTEITKLTFRVPTESDTAGTTGVSIALPTATPFAEVLAEPVPGWTVKVVEGKLPKPVVLDGTTLTKAPVTVTWTADKGEQIGPGEFQEFSLSAGPIPDTASLSFPTTQTYSDGTVVKWDEPQAAGADEPENPLPSFVVTAAAPDSDTADVATASPAAASDASQASSGSGSESASESVSGSESDGLARGLGIGGLVAGLLGLALGVLAWRRGSTRA
jgi:periplasmic copper chaperone A